MINHSTGEIYVADQNNDRIDELGSKGEALGSFGTKGKGAGEMEEPQAVAIDKNGDLWVSDSANNRVDVFTPAGQPKFAFGFGVANEKPEFEICTTTCHAGIAALAPASSTGRRGSRSPPTASSTSLSSTTTASRNSPKRGYRGIFGATGEVESPTGVAIDPSGDIWVADSGRGRVDEFSPSGAEIGSVGSGGSGSGELSEAKLISFDSSGNLDVADAGNNRIDVFRPAKPLAHDTQTVYYSAGTEASVGSCQKRPEWAGQPCVTRPAAQPETQGLPSLAETTITSYNVYGEPLGSEERFGSGVTRTKVEEYDAAGRQSASEVKASQGERLPEDGREVQPHAGRPRRRHLRRLRTQEH